MKKTLFVLSLILVFILFSTVAWSDFYVIAAGKTAKRTVLVSPKSTETASGTALLNALSKITDASATNPYLIIIEPGIYNIGANSLQMKSYVDVQGSGENVTKITGNLFSYTTGVVIGADNMEIRSLSVENTGGSQSTVAMSNSSSSPSITNVTFIASGGSSYNYGVVNRTSSSPIITNITVYASGGTDNTGIANDNSSPKMNNVTIYATGGSDKNTGVLNSASSSPILTNTTVSASGGTYTNGIENLDGASLTMYSVTISASDGSSSNIGVANLISSSAIISDTNISVSGTGGGSNTGVANLTSSSAIISNTNISASGTGEESNIGIQAGINSSAILNYVTIKASSGLTALCYSVFLGNDSSIKINNSSISGTTASVYANLNSTAFIGSTRLEGLVTIDGGTCTCAGVYDENYVFYPSTCP